MNRFYKYIKVKLNLEEEGKCEECNHREVSYVVTDTKTMNGKTLYLCEKCVLPYVDNSKIFLDPSTSKKLENKEKSNYRWEIHEK